MLVFWVLFYFSKNFCRKDTKKSQSMMISPWDLNIIGFLSFLLDDANRYLFLWRFVRFALSSAVCVIFSYSGNDFNLNQCPFRQSLDSNGRPCRVWLREKLCIDRIHIGKVIHVGHEYRCLHHMTHRQTCLLQDSLHVEQRLAGLFLDTSLCKSPKLS